MLIRRGLTACRSEDRGCVVAIGNFDGLHLGHQAILAVLMERGREQGLPAAVLTFEPHPREFLAKAEAPARLMRLRDKAEVLAAAGIAEMRVMRFGAALAGQDAETFIEQVLVRTMRAKRVVIGEGFRFGRGRGGDVALLSRAGQSRGFAVDEVVPYVEGGAAVSSTRVREALAAGRLDEVRALLGRDFRISGRVVAGQALGRRLGMPTANIRLHRRVSPVAGIFAVRVSSDGLERRAGVASVGTRPTVDSTEWLLEVHVFDFDGDLYRRRLDVDFVARLRDERKFDDLDALADEMQRDGARARAMLDA
jgi:riboflavin kinase / FMN adenylyltransferase